MGFDTSAVVEVAATRSRDGANFTLISMIPSLEFEFCLKLGLHSEWQDALTSYPGNPSSRAKSGRDLFHLRLHRFDQSRCDLSRSLRAHRQEQCDPDFHPGAALEPRAPTDALRTHWCHPGNHPLQEDGSLDQEASGQHENGGNAKTASPPEIRPSRNLSGVLRPS